jgi:hypothetical protein
MRCEPDVARLVRGHQLAPQKQKAPFGSTEERLQKSNIMSVLYLLKG